MPILAAFALLLAVSTAQAEAGAVSGRSTGWMVTPGLYRGSTSSGHAFTFRISSDLTIGPFVTTVLYTCRATDGYVSSRYVTYSFPATRVTQGAFTSQGSGDIKQRLPRFSISGRAAVLSAAGRLNVSLTWVHIGQGMGDVHLVTDFCFTPTQSWTAKYVGR